MNYRIYKNVNGWEIVDIVTQFKDVLKIVVCLLNDNVTNFLVIEHDIKQDMDIPIMCCEADYLFHKKEYEGQNEVKNMYVKCKL